MKPTKVIPHLCRGYQTGSYKIAFNEDKVILYALGIGFSADPLNAKELSFTYELDENFKVAPTFGLPEFNPMMLLHGEQKVDIYKPFPTSGSVNLLGEIIDVADKVKGALVTLKLGITEEGGVRVCDCIYKFFIRGLGGFGDKGLINDIIPNVPNRPPDKSAIERTAPSQAILYRLSGDKNPLHISKDMAEMGGFDRPIIHGLCTYGIGAKAVLRDFCQYDARFTSHAFPGETFSTDMWKEGDRVLFSMKTEERGKVIMQGFVDLKPAPKL